MFSGSQMTCILNQFKLGAVNSVSHFTAKFRRVDAVMFAADDINF
jgi:hypothetical protein